MSADLVAVDPLDGAVPVGRRQSFELLVRHEPWLGDRAEAEGELRCRPVTAVEPGSGHQWAHLAGMAPASPPGCTITAFSPPSGSMMSGSKKSSS